MSPAIDQTEYEIYEIGKAELTHPAINHYADCALYFGTLSYQTAKAGILQV